MRNASADEMLIKLVCAGISTPQAAAWFQFTWRHLADEGIVDSYDGMECRRVLAEWAVECCPMDGGLLIRRANIGPDGKEPDANAIVTLSRDRRNV